MKSIPLIALSFLAVINNTSAQETLKAKRNEPSPFRLAIDGGWGYRIARLSNGLSGVTRELVNGLKPGYTFSAEGTYYFPSGLGIGLQYSNFRSSSEAGMFRAKTAIQYIGPTFSAVAVIGQNANLYIGGTASLGFMHYSQKIMYLNQVETFGKGTFGSTTTAFFDAAVAKNIMIGVKATLASGSFSVNGSKERESLTRIDLSGGIRFVF